MSGNIPFKKFNYLMKKQKKSAMKNKDRSTEIARDAGGEGWIQVRYIEW
uniref:Uncharacterized protein n=1 Tax=Onchocerca volvulus TaxID=6282 RepID=A0A8R1XUN7_ONCVO